MNTQARISQGWSDIDRLYRKWENLQSDTHPGATILANAVGEMLKGLLADQPHWEPRVMGVTPWREPEQRSWFLDGWNHAARCMFLGNVDFALTTLHHDEETWTLLSRLKDGRTTAEKLTPHEARLFGKWQIRSEGALNHYAQHEAWRKLRAERIKAQ